MRFGFLTSNPPSSNHSVAGRNKSWLCILHPVDIFLHISQRIVTILPRRWAEFCQNQMKNEKWLLGTFVDNSSSPQLILILRTAILASRPSPTAYPD
eukprot:scaffold8007_cov263-Chaetoceros_neogracile.AAC.12